MLAGIRMGSLNLQAQKLLIDMLNVSNVIANDIRSRFVLFICNRDADLLKAN